MPDNGTEKKNDWLALKIPGTTSVAPYEFEDRAYQVNNQWSVGYDIDEIAAFFKITEIEAKVDLQWVHGRMSPRQVISLQNDRDRIKLQKRNTNHYGRILEESLVITAKDYIAKGMSPVPAMKEYREAVSMTEKPGGIAISFTKNTQNNMVPGGGVHSANISGRNGIKSYEDLVRLVIESDPTCGLQPIIEDDDDQGVAPVSIADVVGEDEDDTDDRLTDE
jgi:hypothetical protein